MSCLKKEAEKLKAVPKAESSVWWPWDQGPLISKPLSSLSHNFLSMFGGEERQLHKCRYNIIREYPMHTNIVSTVFVSFEKVFEAKDLYQYEYKTLNVEDIHFKICVHIRHTNLQAH